MLLAQPEPKLAQAIRSLNEATKIIPALASSPNLQLAGLLMIHASGDHETVLRQIDHPAFEQLRMDSLEYRVELLCRLGSHLAAHRMLDGLMEQVSGEDRARIALESARLRARLADWPGAKGDLRFALESLGADSPTLTEIKAEADSIKRDYPNYANWLRSHPGD
jgi:hypothetical protein